MKKRIIIFAVIAAVIAAVTAFDFIRSQMFVIQVESISPAPSVADGRTPVTIRLRLTTKSGKPVEGHSLFAFSRNGGSFRANRVVTDDAGYATYTYFPYKVTSLVPLSDAVIDVADESNSIFVEINTRASFTIELTAPDHADQSSVDLNSIFGE